MELNSSDEHPLKSDGAPDTLESAKNKELGDNRTFGITKEVMEKFNEPIDDEDISEDSDEKDKSDEDYEDEAFH